MSDLKSLHALIKDRTDAGEWKEDKYTHGLINGLILAVHILDDSDERPFFLTINNPLTDWESEVASDVV